jgi:hypothetical protein
VYNGFSRTATVVTNPPGLAASFTYDGQGTWPINAGTYAVAVTVNDANYTGTASGSLVIHPAPTTIQLTSSKNPARPGLPITFQVTISSPGLTPIGQVTISVDGVPQVLTLSAGTASTVAFNNLAKGGHSVSVSYAGSSNYAASGPAALTQTTMQFAMFVPVSRQ